LLAGAGAASAAKITVTTTDPAIAQDGLCSLIEALDNANDGAVHADCAAGSDTGADVVELGEAETYVLYSAQSMYQGGVGLPMITSAVVLQGNGSTIERANGAPNFRLLVNRQSGDLTIADLVLRNGRTTDNGGGLLNDGGRVLLHRVTVTENEAYNAGGIRSHYGSTVLIDCQVTDNIGNYWVGGIYNGFGSLYLFNSTVAGNHSEEHGGGGIFGWGTNSHTELVGSTISDNTTATAGDGDGAGIRVKYGRLVIRDSSITGNDSTGNGGGLAADDGSTVEIRSSLVADNRADVAGGGIFVENGSSLTVTGCTVTSNTEADGAVTALDSIVTMTNCTVSGNPAGGVLLDYTSAVTLMDSTILDNTGSDLEILDASSDVTIQASIVGACFPGSGTVYSNGWNMAEDASCALDQPTDMIVTDAMLSELGDWGGATPTHVPLENSPAVDMGGDSCSRFDQRGYLQPVDGDGDGVAHCDCGAVEYGAAPLLSGSRGDPTPTGID
jgi:hypothetical protein